MSDPAPAPLLYDTTLRDGTQREGVSLSVEDKLRVARSMDGLGVDLIEGGWPGANPKDTEFFARAAAGELELRHAQLAAFGSTRHARNAVEDDPTVAALLAAGTPVVCLVGKASSYHVDRALEVPRATNLEMVAESVAYLVAQGREVVFDAEHFFDGWRTDAGYAADVASAAAESGASCVVLCDTNGGTMPWEVAGIVRAMVARLPCDVGLHFHDDGGCAVANSLIGVDSGARHVQGTANGLGERCGNANLFTLLADLQLKGGVDVVPQERLGQLTHVANVVAELTNQTLPPVQPYVGAGAFAHKAGLHVSALAKAPDLYQHVDPAAVGNEQRLVVSDQAGRATIALKARGLGIEVDGEQQALLLTEIKRREHAGWSYDAADASFALLVRRVVGGFEEPFVLESFRVTVGNSTGERRPAAEAVVAVLVGGERQLGVGEGNGPVDALDHAFRNAVNGRWPELSRLRLVDYRVRIVEASARRGDGHGTDAITRVLITTTDGEDSWDTVGVHANVVEASWLALADAYAHALTRAAAPVGAGQPR